MSASVNLINKRNACGDPRDLSPILRRAIKCINETICSFIGVFLCYLFWVVALTSHHNKRSTEPTHFTYGYMEVHQCINCIYSNINSNIQNAKEQHREIRKETQFISTANALTIWCRPSTYIYSSGQINKIQKVSLFY